jgi:hypothetical protein
MQISPLICPHTPKALPPLLNPLVLPQHENPLMERYKFRSGLLLPTTISDDPGGTGVQKELEARVGFEPTSDGFADHSLRPLGYRAFLIGVR